MQASPLRWIANQCNMMPIIVFTIDAFINSHYNLCTQSHAVIYPSFPVNNVPIQKI
jgi:hypothetical protein